MAGQINETKIPLNVRCFEENDKNQYKERDETLDKALSRYAKKDCTRLIIFSHEDAFKEGQRHNEINSFFPPSIWRIVKDLNGTFGFERYGESSSSRYDTWSTFKVKHVKSIGPNMIKYRWSQISVFTRQSKTKQLVLFIGCPEDVVERIIKSNIFQSDNNFRDLTGIRHDPFGWHALLVEELRAVYETEVWNLRDVVRDWEKNRAGEPNVELFNEIGRHVIHTKEVFEVTANTIYSILQQHKYVHDEHMNIEEVQLTERNAGQTYFDMVQQKLLLSEKDIRAIRARAGSLQERLRHEIDLAYHVAVRNTTQLSIDVARIARRDNATMKALALIGVLYLPGTFISGIFGMSFFNYNPSNSSDSEDWQMSNKFWIYWAVTIPVTIFTVLLWAILDETVEMYEKLLGRVKTALHRIWRGLPIRTKRESAENTLKVEHD